MTAIQMADNVADARLQLCAKIVCRHRSLSRCARFKKFYPEWSLWYHARKRYENVPIYKNINPRAEYEAIYYFQDMESKTLQIYYFHCSISKRNE